MELAIGNTEEDEINILERLKKSTEVSLGFSIVVVLLLLIAIVGCAQINM